MNQSVLKRMLSRGAFIFLVILGVYFLVSTLWLTILSGSWIISLVVVVLFSRLPYYFSTKPSATNSPSSALGPPLPRTPASVTISAYSPCATTPPGRRQPTSKSPYLC